MRNECINATRGFHVEVMLTRKLTGKAGFPRPETIDYQFWTFHCDRSGKTCEAAHARVEGNTLELHPVTSAEVILDTGKIAIVQAGPWKTFTIDFVERVVRYAEIDDTINIEAAPVGCKPASLPSE